MSLTIGVIVLIGAVVLNIAWVIIEKRLDSKPSVPNYRPDEGVDDESLSAVPKVLKNFSVPATSVLTKAILLPHDIRLFFDCYEELRLDAVICLNRSYLVIPYGENEIFIKIGLMNEEDDLLVKKNGRDANIYIVGSEDGNPKNPELFATSFNNLLAIAWHDYKQLEEQLTNGHCRECTSGFDSWLVNWLMASLGGIIILCVDIVPLFVSVWFLFSFCIFSDEPLNIGMLVLGIAATVAFGLIALLSVRSIVQSWHRSRSMSRIVQEGRNSEQR